MTVPRGMCFSRSNGRGVDTPRVTVPLRQQV